MFGAELREAVGLHQQPDGCRRGLPGLPVFEPGRRGNGSTGSHAWAQRACSIMAWSLLWVPLATSRVDIASRHRESTSRLAVACWPTRAHLVGHLLKCRPLERSLQRLRAQGDRWGLGTTAPRRRGPTTQAAFPMLHAPQQRCWRSMPSTQPTQALWRTTRPQPHLLPAAAAVYLGQEPLQPLVLQCHAQPLVPNCAARCAGRAARSSTEWSMARRCCSNSAAHALCACIAPRGSHPRARSSAHPRQHPGLN